MTVALTIGSFDPVHVDHVLLFRRCERYADEVVVGVNSDRFYETYRKAPPMFTENERLQQVRRLGYAAMLNDGPGRELIKDVRPDIIVVGHDWLDRGYLEQIGVTPEDLQNWKVALLFVPRGDTISSSDIRERRA